MRFEWGPIISHRRWDLLEVLAKREPSQQLCDTVNELVLGFPDREDKRPLKRVLFVLKQAGFEPGEEANSASEPDGFRAAFALQSSADRHGYVFFALAVQDGATVQQLLVDLNFRWRYVRVSPAAYPISRLADSKLWMLEKCPMPVIVEIDAGFCLYRIQQAWATHRHGKKFYPNGFWKRVFAQAEEQAHPTAKLASARLSSSERQEWIARNESISSWRLALPATEEVWEPLHEARWADDEDPAPRIESILMEAREELCSDEVLAEHSLRLRDLAYLESRKGIAGFGETLAVALDLEDRRAESDYFRLLLKRTATDLDLEEDDLDVPGCSWGVGV